MLWAAHWQIWKVYNTIQSCTEHSWFPWIATIELITTYRCLSRKAQRGYQVLPFTKTKLLFKNVLQQLVTSEPFPVLDLLKSLFSVGFLYLPVYYGITFSTALQGREFIFYRRTWSPSQLKGLTWDYEGGQFTHLPCSESWGASQQLLGRGWWAEHKHWWVLLTPLCLFCRARGHWWQPRELPLHGTGHISAPIRLWDGQSCHCFSMA